ncbi:enoyl-CoA hydratase [Paraburkholderia ginsengiterrae]|uniref:Enoyl-CoA hydratase n=1 Tax=Paraburkholderia ginsengiterrae TaxID=1462993 RepID=A0A1A9N4H6_9BURK|nr:enoyl-CoA hydratase-related protein [Paraburkholderia ginsengiterrae]OAJ57419.1 enoyl-CoA hydratase [Paraburkholderia ginsengiterrae]OAJ58290.1 enoyl-CoA hydratase [Paraburkholderia ginsengiterrae]
MTPEIKAELSDNGVLAVTISRPDKKNALTNDMYAALADAIAKANEDDEIRVLLFQADGDMFSAGNDISEFAAQAMGNGPEERNVFRFLRGLANATVPIVAAVQGKAVGVGTTMLLHCDYVLLSTDAQLITPFVNLALVPEAASSLLLPSCIGHVKAFEMFALGEPVSAESAVAWGIANKVVAAEELRAEALRIAGKLALKPAGSLTAMKQLMRDAEKLTARIDRESAIFAERLASDEAKEAFAAFAQKRQPDFTKIVRK